MISEFTSLLGIILQSHKPIVLQKFGLLMNGIEETLTVCERRRILTTVGCCRTGLCMHVGLKARVVYKLLLRSKISDVKNCRKSCPVKLCRECEDGNLTSN